MCNAIGHVYSGGKTYMLVVRMIQYTILILCHMLKVMLTATYTVILQWLEHLWNPEKMLETGVVSS